MKRSPEPISLAGSQLGEVRHVCAFFANDDEEYRVLLPFIREGLSCGDKAVQGHQSRGTRGASAAPGWRRASTQPFLCKSGQLQIRINTEVYLRDGRFDQGRMLAAFEEMASSARTAEGFPMSRIVCRMDWASADQSRIDDVIEFESRVNEVWHRYDDAVICTYHLGQLSGDAVIDIMRTHPMVIIGGHLQQNPFFTRPEESLRDFRGRRSRTNKSPVAADHYAPTTTDPATEIKRLQRCMNDLVSVLALPAVWSVSEPGRILDTFLDALMGILDLDFLYARARFGSHESTIEALRAAPPYGTSGIREELRQALNQWSGENPQQWPDSALGHLAGQKVSFFPIRLGIDGELGLIVAGSQRLGFPEQTESLVFGVAANQLAIGLQQTVRVNAQKQIANELDRRVAERTRELAEANNELQLQVGLLQHLPVSAWTLMPDGTPDFVNRVWLEFSGQTPDFVRSHPEAWMAAVHPEDREEASRTFWEGVRSGQSFAFETRSLRAQDGTYRWHLQQAVVLRNSEGKVLKFVGTTTDIDDQKRAEEARRASETNLRQILDSIPGLVSTMSPAGETEFVNRTELEYFGKTFDELKNWSSTDSDAVHPDDLPRMISEFTHSITTGTLFEIEIRLRRADGVYRWFQGSGRPVRDKDGRITGWYFLITDIEGRKRAEDALQASETNLREIINNIPGLVCTLNLAGQIELANQPTMDYFGMTIEELNRWGINGAVHQDDLPRVIVELTHSMTTGSIYDSELRYRRADGLYRWNQTRILPARDPEGRITRWYGLITDIDDRKRAEEAVRASENNFRQIVDNIPGLVATLSPSGEIELVNQQYLEYFGKSLDEIKSWRVNDVLHPDDLLRMEASFARALTAGTALIEEFRYRRADGVFRWFHARVFPMMDRSGAIGRWFVLAADIDDRRRAENALNELRSELAHMARVTSLGALTASIAHEVNQPLAGIVTNASTCLRTLSTDPPNIDVAQEAARRTIRDGNRASDVIQRLRTLFSKKQIEVEPLDLNEATREVVALLSGELEKNDVILIHEFSDHCQLSTAIACNFSRSF